MSTPATERANTSIYMKNYYPKTLSRIKNNWFYLTFFVTQYGLKFDWGKLIIKHFCVECVRVLKIQK